MSMDVGGAKGGVKSDINVTPLVDVMLVLLIIMMLIAPMLQKGVELTLPMAANTPDKPDTSDQTVVYVDAQQQALRERARSCRSGRAVASAERPREQHRQARSTSRATRTRPTARSWR